MRFNDYWKIPKNAKAYFSPKCERELKAKYGVWYTVHTVISVFILFVPFVVFLLLSPVDAFHPTTSVGNLLGAIGAIIGLIGSCSIAVGLVNIFMALIKQYLGHLVTFGAIVGGLLLDVIGWLVLSFVR